MPHHSRRSLLSGFLATGAAGGLAPRAGHAQQQAAPAWPTRPVTVLLPFAPGGPSDTVARAIAVPMQQGIGQPVVVENRAAANGQVAARQLAQSKPDGHTIMVGSIGVFALNAVLYRDPGYDPVRDFAPITLAVTTPNVLVVNPQQVPATDLPGLLAWMRANPGKAFHATSGIGSSPHLTMVLFTQLTGTEATHVPSRGAATAVTDQIAGRAPISFQGLGTVVPYVRDGRLRPILVTSAARSPLLPEVPTGIESGLAGFEVTSWQAAMAPAAVPAPVLHRLHEAVTTALRDPEVAPRLEAAGYAVVAGSPEDYAAFQRAEIGRWRRVAGTAGISLD
jgi:tripartite-type tricarboxylate transporter receptor subunit TctC